MANKATRSHTIKFAHKAQDAVGYELVSTTSNVHISADGKLSPAGITYVAHRVTGSKREVLTCDTTASEFAVWAVFTGRARQQIASNKNLSAKLATDYYPCHLDLVRRDAGENYAQSDILATIPISMQRDGQDGSQGAFTSIAFTRSTKNLNSAEFTPEGGTYSDPNPTTPGWSDEPPEGTDQLWMSRAKFTPDMTDETKEPRPEWSKPSPVADSTDMEIIWSAKENPAAPAKQHTYPDNLGDWGKNPSGAIWMAVALKNNGAWGEWKVVRIKGEKGDNGKDAVMAVLTPDNLVFKAGVRAQKSVTVTMRTGSSTAIPSDVTATGLPTGLTMSTARDTTAKTVTLTFSYDGTAEFDTSLLLIAQYLRQGYKLTLGVSTVSDGSNGKPGEDAVSVNVGINGIVFKRGSLPEYVDIPITAFKGSTALMPYSGFMVLPVDADELKGAGFSDYTVWSNGSILYLRLTVDSQTESPEGKVSYNVLIVESKIVYPQEISVMTVADGGKGAAGPWIPTPMPWEYYDEGYEFRSGKEATGDASDYKSVVFDGQDSSGRFIAYQCVTTHTKTSDSKRPSADLQSKTNPNGRWTAFQQTFSSLATDLLLSQNAFIKLMSSNGISIFDGQNLCGQIIGSGQAESRRLIWMGGTAKNPKWAVNNEGVHFIGDPEGQHIELDPVSRKMLFYNDKGELTATHSGRELDYETIIPAEVGSSTPVSMAILDGKVTMMVPGTQVTGSGYPEITLPELKVSAVAPSVVTQNPTGGTSALLSNSADGRLVLTVESGGQTWSKVLCEASAFSWNKEQVSNTGTFPAGSVRAPILVAKGSAVSVSVDFVKSEAGAGRAVSSSPSGGKLEMKLIQTFYRAEYAANGFVLAVDSKNFVYFLFKAGVLHAKCVAGGKTVFEG